MDMITVATYENNGENLTCPQASITASHSSVNGTKFFK
jgi:hypothetical protein